METKLTKIAKLAKKDGYKYITSIVKSRYNTTYYHVIQIDFIIEKGKWIPAPFGLYGIKGRIGITAKHLPENTISKKELYKKYGSN